MSAEQRIMEIAKLKAAGKEAEAQRLLDDLKRDYPRANGPETDEVLRLMVKHMR